MKQTTFTVGNRTVTIDQKHRYEVSMHSWRLSRGYVITSLKQPNGYFKNVGLHNFVFEQEFGTKYPLNGLTVDHLDRDVLNNSILNLCPSTRTLQQFNRLMRVGVSGFRGVTRHGKKWKAELGQIKKYLGVFDTPKEASIVYETARTELIKELQQDLINNLPQNESLHAIIVL